MAKKKTTHKNHASLAQAMSSSRSSAMSTKQMSARQLMVATVLWFIAHSVIVYFANRWYPDAVVLGTNVISPMMAMLYSMVVLTLLTVGSIPVVELLASQFRIKMGALHWFLSFLVIDAAALWLVARFAEQLGLGLSSWMVAAVLAVIIDLVQGALIQMVPKE